MGGWVAAASAWFTTRFTSKTKVDVDSHTQQVNDADAAIAGDGVPEINRNDQVVATNEKSVVQVQGGSRTAEALAEASEVRIDVHATKDDEDNAGEEPDQDRRARQHAVDASTSSSGDSLFPRLSNPRSASPDRLSRLTITRSPIHEIRQSISGKRQRLHELVKKNILLKSVLLVALVESSYPSQSNSWFIASLVACILALLADVLCAVMLINLASTIPVCCLLACLSSFSTMLVPYFLLVSMDKLSAYVILAGPLAATVVVVVNCAWAPAPADEVDGNHVFDVSSAVTNVAAGGGLTGMIFGNNMSSQQSMVTMPGPIGFLLFFTICLGLYLMLVATVRPKALTRHIEHLTYMLLLLLGATALVAAVEFAGWLACTVASVDIIEAAVSAAFVKAHGTATTREVDTAGRKNEQRLTSIVIATILFTLVMQLHSQKSIAGDSLGQYEALRMLLYFSAFLWSFNRMLFLHEASAVADGGDASGVWPWAWSAVQLVRTIVVVLAVLDHMYCNLFFLL